MSLLDRIRRESSWPHASIVRGPLPPCGLNMAHEAVDRHAAGPLRDKVAIRWRGEGGERRSLTYGDLARASSRFAGALQSLGVQAGDRVFALAERIPELHIAALGALKHRTIFSPLSTALGPEPIRQRMEIGRPHVLVTTERLYHEKVAPLRGLIPDLERVIVIGAGGHPVAIPGALDWSATLAPVADTYRIVPTEPTRPALLHFTTGATGTPRGAVHAHQAVVLHDLTGRLALDLHADDVFWCTADPGSATGTAYGILAPLANGVTLVIDEADLDAERCYRVLDEERVSVFYSTPGLIRLLVDAGAALPARHDLRRLRFIASVGEPLDASAVVWSTKTLGRPIHDTWSQTETGGILIANLDDVRPGSMGRPLPGVEAAVVSRGAEHLSLIDAPDVAGELALRPGWPSMFVGYWENPERYALRFADGWYLTGDVVKRDRDGYYWFVGHSAEA
jgi:acetyl-CoA synthetase